MSTSIGSAVSRKDGHLKVTGQARYAADHPMKNVAHAVAICSTVASGRVAGIDSADAEKSPGFLAILHHGNAPKMFRPVNNFMSASKPGEIRVVFEDDKVHYAGQYLAVVVAETLQQAQHADAISPIAMPGADEPGLPPAASGGNVMEMEPRAPAPAPFVRAVPKVGRNEPCPCGSGRKYKHCHGALQQASG